VEPEQVAEWDELQTAAKAGLRDGRWIPAGSGPRLARVLERPAFAPAVAYAVCDARSDSADEPGGALWVVRVAWRRDLDLPKFGSPVERLRVPQALAPTVEVARAAADPGAFFRLLEALRAAPVPALAGDPETLGLDGVTYELALDYVLTGARYRWWVKPPPGWEPLGAFARGVIALGDAAVGPRPWGSS